MFTQRTCKSHSHSLLLILALAMIGIGAGVGLGFTATPATPAQDADALAQDSPVVPEAPIRTDGTGQTVLITGANRGLGLEFAKQMNEAGYEVIATCRKPDEAQDLNALGVRVEQLDVADAESVARLAEAIGDDAIDVLINNAGVGGGPRRLEDIDVDQVKHIIDVNTIGPMRVTQALLGAMRAGERKLIVNITSGLGSITNNTGYVNYGYRESKAALNMFTRSVANELRPEGFICIVMSPGWVRTRMGGPNARISPEQSIGGMLDVMDGLTTEDTGTFQRYTGENPPW